MQFFGRHELPPRVAASVTVDANWERLVLRLVGAQPGKGELKSSLVIVGIRTGWRSFKSNLVLQVNPSLKKALGLRADYS